MTRTEIKNKIAELETKLFEFRKQLLEMDKETANTINQRIDNCHMLKDKFMPDELIFAAHNRCICGAGLAYPKNIGIHGAWYCGDILLGRALGKNDPNHKEHTNGLSFVFYSIKSENQPSANGATTRPVNLKATTNQ